MNKRPVPILRDLSYFRSLSLKMRNIPIELHSKAGLMTRGARVDQLF
jgi:hypothetical protein